MKAQPVKFYIPKYNVVMSTERFSSYRIMWVFIFFDLPTETKKQRKAAADFRKNLLLDGFTMFQYSIYVRHCASRENMQVHIDRVIPQIPDTGKVCIIQLTDRQFSDIRIFEGTEAAIPHNTSFQLELF